MDANIDVQSLVDLRNNILEEILHNLRDWDNTLESGINLIESNQINLNRIADVNSKLYEATKIEYDESYIVKLNLILTEIEKLTISLRGKREDLIVSKQQVNKKDQVISSYISGDNKSIFIDKDVK